MPISIAQKQRIIEEPWRPGLAELAPCYEPILKPVAVSPIMEVPNSKFHSQLIEAIKEKYLIRFFFKGKERIVEPHDYGILNGIVTLLAYQLRGESSSPLPGWRLITNVVRISKFEVLKETFPGGRGDAHSRHHKWDKIFARVEERAESSSDEEPKQSKQSKRLSKNRRMRKAS